MASVKFQLILFCCIIFSSCENHKIKGCGDCEYYEINITKELLSRKIDPTSLLSDYKIIKLETAQDEYIDYIGSLKVLGDTMYILDSRFNKAVFRFTTDGQYINKVRRIGKGPGEYTQLADFDVDKNGNILMLDWNTGSIITYDGTGHHISSLKLGNRFSSFKKYNDKYLLSNHFSNKKKDYLLNILDDKGKKKKFYFPSQNYQNCSQIMFRIGGNFFGYNDECRYFIPETDTVYQITDKLIKPYLALTLPCDIQKDKNYRPNIFSYSENETFIYFKTEINSIPYDIFFNKKTKEIIPISIFKLEENFTQLPINILCISGRFLIASVSKNSMEYIQSLINSGKIKDDKVKDFVENGSSNLLVFYEFK